jgi:hypothetical protein
VNLRKAERKQAKLRVGITAPSGGGKTYSALLLAHGLVGDWSKIAIIDTENGSGELYSSLGGYNVLPLDAPYTPERYIEAIRTCERAGMGCIIIDSATHEWDGQGGCLEIVSSLGGKYQDWAKVTPRHQKFLDAILQSPCHIVTTTRRKQDYEMTKESNGRVIVEKVGLKEVQRDGFEYELTLNLELDRRHNATASKDRTGLFADKPEFIITAATGATLKAWCESGAAPAPVIPTAPNTVNVAQAVATLAAAKDMSTPSSGVSITNIEARKTATGTEFWVITFSDGRSGSTLDAELHAVAKEYRDDGVSVRPSLAPSPKDPKRHILKALLQTEAA